MTRVPATLREAQEALSQADPPTMTPLMEGYRSHEWASVYGDVSQRWLLIHSAPRQSQAQGTVNKQLLKQGDQEVKAFKKLCGTAFACEADAQQALSTFEQGLQATVLAKCTVRPTPRDGQRGRPGPGAPPAHMVYYLEGALASRVAARQALMAQQSGFILATNELDDTRLPPQELLEGYKGQGQAERSFRFLKDPCFLAASLYLKKPERIMALLMVMTGVCGLGIPHSPCTQGPGGDVSGPKRQTHPAPYRTMGLPLFCRDTRAVHLSTMDPRHQPDGRAPAPAPPSGKALWVVLPMNIHPNQSPSAECQICQMSGSMTGDRCNLGSGEL